MKQIVLVTPNDATHGFRLAGVRHLTATATEVGALLLELSRDARNGIVIVDERLADRSARERMHDLDQRWNGLVVVLPAPQKVTRTEEDYVLQLIRRAIGYQVRLS